MAEFQLTNDRLIVRGILDSDGELQLRKGLQQLLASGAAAVTVDLSKVESINSICVGSLVAAWIDFRSAGKRAALVASPAVRKVLDLTGLSNVFGGTAGPARSGPG